MPCPAVRLGPELVRLSVREVLVQADMDVARQDALAEAGASVTPLGPGSFDSTSAEKRLSALFDVASLDAFGTFSRAELSALGALSDYLEITQKGALPLLRPPRRHSSTRLMQIDVATRRNLELTRSMAGARQGSLLYVLDRTVTAGGARLLERRVSGPATSADEIARRQDGVAHFVSDMRVRDDIRASLRQCPDIERALSRLALDRGGPRDLAALRDGLAQAAEIADRLPEAELPEILREARSDCLGHEPLRDMLDAALVAEPPVQARDGGFIAPGHDADLDAARTLRDEGRGVIAKLQADYAAETGVSRSRSSTTTCWAISSRRPPPTRRKCCPRRCRNGSFIARPPPMPCGSRPGLVGAGDTHPERRVARAGDRDGALPQPARGVLAEHDRIGQAARALAELDVQSALAARATEGAGAAPRSMTTVVSTSWRAAPGGGSRAGPDRRALRRQ
jgi:DNA mismatch repair protein MutS